MKILSLNRKFTKFYQSLSSEVRISLPYSWKKQGETVCNAKLIQSDRKN